MNKIILSFSFFLLLHSSILADDEKNDILKSMEFPTISFEAGKILSDPLFAVNISRKNIDPAEIKNAIMVIEKSLASKTGPDKYFDLGKLYYSISDFEKSAFYFNRYLQIKPVLLLDTTDKKLFETRGEIFFFLSKTVTGRLKKDYLEKSLYYFSRALEQDKDSLVFLERIGDCLLYISRVDESINFYKKIQELDHNNPAIFFKLQAAVFQRDYTNFTAGRSKYKSYPFNHNDYHFGYLESAKSIIPKDLFDSINIQKQLYLLRILMYDYNRPGFKNGLINISDKEKLIADMDRLFKNINRNVINKNDFNYINAIISLLKNDSGSSIFDLNELLNSNDPVYRFVEDEIFNIYVNIEQSSDARIKFISDSIRVNPTPEKYLSLARIEFLNGNIERSEKLSFQAIKADNNYAEGYSALSVIYAHKGNYLAAECMIKKGNSLLQNGTQSDMLWQTMKVNEAVIALLKNERERSYILLRSVLSIDDNEKGLLLYNRYFNKK